jgi:hypothetical protein
MTGDGLLELRRRTTLVRGINPRGARQIGAQGIDRNGAKIRSTGGLQASCAKKAEAKEGTATPTATQASSPRHIIDSF